MAVLVDPGRLHPITEDTKGAKNTGSKSMTIQHNLL